MDVGGALPKAEIWTWLDKIWRSLPAGREVGWVAPDQTSPQSADGSEKGRVLWVPTRCPGSWVGHLQIQQESSCWATWMLAGVSIDIVQHLHVLLGSSGIQRVVPHAAGMLHSPCEQSLLLAQLVSLGNKSS